MQGKEEQNTTEIMDIIEDRKNRVSSDPSVLPEDETVKSEDETTDESSTSNEDKPNDQDESTDEEKVDKDPDKESEGEDPKETEGEESDEVEDEDEEKEVVSNTQRRIDELTKEKYETQAKNQALTQRIEALEKASSSDKESQVEKYFTDKQLEQAESKAIAENDIALLSEVYKERERNLEKRLVDRYKSDQKSQVDKGKKVSDEDREIIDTFASSNPEMDVRRADSKLQKTALAFIQDPELKSKYVNSNGSWKPGGKLLVVTHAYISLRDAKLTQGKSSKEKKLERRLAKEKRKTSIGKSSAGEPQKGAIQSSSKDSFGDYMKDRESRKDKLT